MNKIYTDISLIVFLINCFLKEEVLLVTITIVLNHIYNELLLGYLFLSVGGNPFAYLSKAKGPSNDIRNFGRE